MVLVLPRGKRRGVGVVVVAHAGEEKKSQGLLLLIRDGNAHWSTTGRQQQLGWQHMKAECSLVNYKLGSGLASHKERWRGGEGSWRGWGQAVDKRG